MAREDDRELIALALEADWQRRKVAAEQFDEQQSLRTAGNMFEVWITEHRMNAERKATARLTLATWALMGTTGVLVLATVVLAIVTAVHHGG
jgi:hypothetical protein